MTQPITEPERLTWLLELLGPEGLARMSRELTDEENALVEAALDAHGGDPVATLAPTFPNLPADVQAEMRRVMAVTR